MVWQAPQFHNTSFRGWNRNRLLRRRIKGTPAPLDIKEYRLDPAKWTNGLGPSKKRRGSRHAGVDVGLTIDAILGQNKDELICLVCRQFIEDCDAENDGEDDDCYLIWRRGPARRLYKSIEIRDTGISMGNGAYVKPGCRIEKWKWLGEYLGELLPLGTANIHVPGLYTFEIAGIARVCAQTHGNLTRFFNHSCDNNVEVRVECVGGRQIVAFQAKRDIEENEQIFIDYGPDYFRDTGLRCVCGSVACRYKGAAGRKRKR
ncbi:hypothetical protein TruAng_011327 [Truncatella angustata]|nr:hypothetical protein TruAng_011327 [Truncatella angustata]